ncbi:hypothetical protein ACOBQX_24060 [Actinokineospora sp. G85]|uniref:hypothetical protein n=1 Tax=Actinokineospora sp. G85 TaxID=3406626 RepID=UPI003C711F41
MAAETEHKKGHEGVLLVKRWLESTTHAIVNFSVYDDENQTSLARLDDNIKRYDLIGTFLGKDTRPFVVEVKNYNVVGNQPIEYTEFLANAYSTTAAQFKLNLDKKIEYMWITWHPFSQGKWSKLTSEDEIRNALEVHPEVLNGAAIEESLIRLLADRIWLIMLNRRQESLLLSRDELFKVHGVLERKGMM